MVKLSNQERLKPWMGVILFVVGVVFLLIPGSIIQVRLGTWGIVITELSFLLMAILYCVIRKVSLKEVFPVKKVTVSDLFGTFFMFIGAFMVNLLTIGISLFMLNLLKIGSAAAEIEALSDAIYGGGVGYVITMLVVAVLPAICEEAFMRGAVLSNFRSIGKDWVIVLIIGVMFGILHLSSLRFLNTACFGAVLAFIMVKKNNIILPMLMHFMNNLVSSIVGLMGSGSGSAESSVSALESMNYTTLLGSFLTLGCLAPIFFVLGAMLLDKEHHRPRRFLIAGIISAALFFGGIGISTVSAAAGTLTGDTILTWNYSSVVTEEDMQNKNLAEAGIELDEEKDCMIIVSATAFGADLTFTMTDENGNVIVSKTSSGMLVISEAKTLAPGKYTLEFTGNSDIVGKNFAYEVIVK